MVEKLSIFFQLTETKQVQQVPLLQAQLAGCSRRMEDTTLFRILCLLLYLAHPALGKVNSTAPRSLTVPKMPPSHWNEAARQDLTQAREHYRCIKDYQAKNAILFLGDGMGMTTVTTGRILKGQMAGTSGEEAVLAFERFPHTGLAKTYNTDTQTPDSAGTATAFLCGVKAKSGTMGVNDLVASKNCTSHVTENFVYSFLIEAQKMGKSVGIVTTTRITHATPGAAYAHVAWRDWETDTSRDKGVPDMNERQKCPDVAQQLVDYAINFTVLFGGGRSNFLPKTESSVDAVNGKLVSGYRTAKVNLVEEWKQRHKVMGRRAKYLETRDQLANIKPGDADFYLGLFAPSHLAFVIDDKKGKEPTLEEMTTKAIQILQRNPNGFVLLAEGGRIDHAHHNNLAKKAMFELLEFDKAIKRAGELTSTEDTLTVVTADHSHVFSIGGWAKRGQPLFGKVDYTLDGVKNSKGETLSLDNKPYTSLFYADGPSATANGSRADITNVDTEDSNYQQQSLVKFKAESHGSEDVPVYAQGPGAHLFHTTHEQTYVAHVIRHSLCIGAYAAEGFCLRNRQF